MVYRTTVRRQIALIIIFITSIFFPQIARSDDPRIASFEQQVTSYRNIGEPEQSVIVALKFVAYVERKYGYVHKNTVNAWHILGQAYFSDGRYSNAVRAFRKALKIDERIVGPNHKDLVPHLEALTTVYYSLVRYKEAEKLRQRAQRISR